VTLYATIVSYYNAYQNDYRTKIMEKFALFELDVVMYDESEYFRPWDHPLFNYPYTPRKNILNTIKISNLTFGAVDYKFLYQKIKLQKSTACL